MSTLALAFTGASALVLLYTLARLYYIRQSRLSSYLDRKSISEIKYYNEVMYNMREVRFQGVKIPERKGKEPVEAP